MALVDQTDSSLRLTRSCKPTTVTRYLLPPGVVATAVRRLVRRRGTNAGAVPSNPPRFHSARAFIPGSLRRLAIPVAIVAGIDDRIVPIRSNAQLLAKLIPRASLMLWPGGVEHYTFLATCMEAGRRMQPTLCTDAQGVDREQIHQRTVHNAVQFFDRTLQ